MQKRIYAILFVVAIGFVFIYTQREFQRNYVNIVLCDDREKKLEQSFPFADYVKEIYGVSNRVLSPNEKIEGTIATVRDEDGYLQTINMVGDISEYKNNLRELNQVCHDAGCDFAYISFPSKINSNLSSETYGIDTNGEETRQELLGYLNESGIDFLDVRALFEKDGYSTKDIFYKTDHHWKTTAGFYAAEAIASYLNEQYGYNLSTNALDASKFEFATFDNLWLGETGRSLSKTWVGALDDFTKIVPKYDTSIRICQADGNSVTGEFEIMMDESGYTGEIDYYSYSAHYSYSNYMGSPTTYHNNFYDKNGKKILLIKDSFSAVVVPFLILETSDVTVWDMRIKNEGMKLYDYIRENDFDVVLVAYTDFWVSDMWNFD